MHGKSTARGATRTATKDAAHGMREIIVTTIDGHRIVFAEERAP